MNRRMEKEYKGEKDGQRGKTRAAGRADTSAGGAIEAAVGYLAAKDRSAHEVRTFLGKKAFSRQIIEETMETLSEKGFVNDLRYARYYILEACDKGKSRNRIQQELEQKGIRPSDVQLAFELQEEIPSDEEAALKEAEKILKREGACGKTLRKIASRLAYLGFERDTVYEIIEKLSDEYAIYDFSS